MREFCYDCGSDSVLEDGMCAKCVRKWRSASEKHQKTALKLGAQVFGRQNIGKIKENATGEPVPAGE